MRRILGFTAAAFVTVSIAAAVSLPPALGAADTQRPIGLADIMAWKSIGTPTVSNDGRWFAYRLAPREGNGEVVVRRVSDEKELRYPAGSPPQAGARS